MFLNYYMLKCLRKIYLAVFEHDVRIKRLIIRLESEAVWG